MARAQISKSQRHPQRSDKGRTDSAYERDLENQDRFLRSYGQSASSYAVDQTEEGILSALDDHGFVRSVTTAAITTKGTQDSADFVSLKSFLLRTKINPFLLVGAIESDSFPRPTYLPDYTIGWKLSVVSRILEKFALHGADALEIADGVDIYLPRENRGSTKRNYTLAEVLAAAAKLSLDDQRTLAREVDRSIEIASDPVAREIASSVKDTWDERKRDHSGEPWIKNPSRFVEHVYGRWHRAGTLRQKHLRHDPVLYTRYAKHISQRPQDDLQLERVPTGRPRKPRLQKPII